MVEAESSRCNQPLQRYASEGRDNMNWKILKKRKYLNLFSAIILMVGLGSAALIYQRAGNDPYGALGYEVVDGTRYPIMPENSKLYRHNLEVYGGKFTVIMDDFRRWFVGLWHGKSLAFTVACITIFISLGFFFVAYHLQSDLKSDAFDENKLTGNK